MELNKSLSKKIIIKDAVFLLLLIFFLLNTGINKGQEIKLDEKDKAKSKFVLDEKNEIIRLLDSTGKEIKKIEFKFETKKRKEKYKTDDKDIEYEVDDNKSIKGYISGDGQYAAIISVKCTFLGDTRFDNISTKISYIDTNNKVLWEKKDLGFFNTEIQISQDGSRIAYVKVINSEGVWVVVCNREGKEIFKIELKGNIFDIYLTNNGKFGYIHTVFKTKDNRLVEYVCFSVDSGEIYFIESSLARGNVDISEDGEVTVKIGREYYLDGFINHIKKSGKILHRYKLK